jgi:hypothetical protein
MYGDSINHAVSISNTGDVVKDTQAGMDAARNERLSSERLPRAIIGIIVIIILLNFAAWHTKEYLGWIILSIITYLVIFNIKYVFLDQKTYSLSSVSDAMSLISSTGLSVVIALFISWILFVIGSRVYQLKPFYAADATLKFILSTLAVLAIPIVVHYIINGPVVTWALPNFLINFLGLLYLIQVLFVAVIGLFLTGISAVIGVFGHKKAIVRSDDGFKPEYKSTLP